MEPNEQTPQGTTDPGQPTSTPPAEDTLYDIDVGGGQTQKVSLSELRGGYLRQQDYTRKTQEVSDMRKRYQAYEEFDSLLKNNPELTREITQAVAKATCTSQPEPEPLDYNQPSGQVPYGSSVPGDVGQRIAFLEDQLARKDVEAALDKLSEKYPDANVEEVVRYTLDKNLGVDFETAYKAIAFDKAVSKASQEGEQRGVRSVIDAISDRELSFIPVAGGGQSPGLREMDLSNAEKQYAKALGISEKDYIESKKKIAERKSRG